MIPHSSISFLLIWPQNSGWGSVFFLPQLASFLGVPDLSSVSSVVKVLSLRKAQAWSILEVLRIIQCCTESLGQPHCFHPPYILFLLELLTCQKEFTK